MFWQGGISWWSRSRRSDVPVPARDGTAPEVDGALWQVTCGSDAGGWRDVTDEVGDLTYSHVRPGGPASCSFSVPADLGGVGYNELQPDEELIVRYAGELAWSGYVLPRGLSYRGN